MMKNITPPAIRKPLTDIPKKLKSNSPANANTESIMKAVSVALKAVCRLNFGDKSLVIAKKTVETPSGFINAKKLVNTNKPKVISSCTVVDLKI